MELCPSCARQLFRRIHDGGFHCGYCGRLPKEPLRFRDAPRKWLRGLLALLIGGCVAASGTTTTWHHSLNSPREVSKDLAECAVQAAQANYVLPNVFDLCMLGRGYSRQRAGQSEQPTATVDIDVASAKEIRK